MYSIYIYKYECNLARFIANNDHLPCHVSRVGSSPLPRSAKRQPPQIPLVALAPGSPGSEVICSEVGYTQGKNKNEESRNRKSVKKYIHVNVN